MLATRYIFFTDNVDRMVSFYRDVMRMAVLMPPEVTDHDPKGWVRLSSGGMEIGIHRAGKPVAQGGIGTSSSSLSTTSALRARNSGKREFAWENIMSCRSLNAATSRIPTETRCRFRIGKLGNGRAPSRDTIPRAATWRCGRLITYRKLPGCSTAAEMSKNQG